MVRLLCRSGATKRRTAFSPFILIGPFRLGETFVEPSEERFLPPVEMTEGQQRNRIFNGGLYGDCAGIILSTSAACSLNHRRCENPRLPERKSRERARPYRRSCRLGVALR